jgi:hypothetical protein
MSAVVGHRRARIASNAASVKEGQRDGGDGGPTLVDEVAAYQVLKARQQSNGALMKTERKHSPQLKPSYSQYTLT